eukprot:8454493-Alexandrium_andersonii.AAC.1
MAAGLSKAALSGLQPCALVPDGGPYAPRANLPLLYLPSGLPAFSAVGVCGRPCMMALGVCPPALDHPHAALTALP